VKRDYYEILELARSASSSEIKAAYRKKALQYHPDRNPDHQAEDLFKEASEAYEVLSDPNTKSLYDQYGHAGLANQGVHGFSDVGDIFSHFSDIFEDFFGFGTGSSRNSARAQQGRDLRYDLSLEFIEAYHGSEKKIEVHKEENCEECGGLGHPKGKDPISCPHCGGKGQLYHSQGFFTISSPCAACRGQGKVFQETCSACRGRGSSPKAKKIQIKIPAGVDDEMQLCVRGEGEAGRRGGPAGDLYVFLHVAPHPHLHRQGADLHLEQKITMVQAALGEETEVELVEGKERLRVPEGTQTGDVFRLKGKGMPHLREKKFGDLLVRFFVETPKNLSPAQKELLRQMSPKPAASPSSESSFTKSEKASKKSKKSSWF